MPPPGGDTPQQWARQSGGAFKRTREAEGFVIEWTEPALLRLEWGPSRRHYLPGCELRLRTELEVPPDLQALLMTRPLLEKLEHEVYAQATGGVQTRLDDATPEEMRWLAMLEPVNAGVLGPALQPHYAAVSSAPQWVRQWLQEDFGRMLAEGPQEVITPLVLMLSGRRLTLRTSLPSPDTGVMQRCRHLLASAAGAALQATRALAGRDSRD